MGMLPIRNLYLKCRKPGFDFPAVVHDVGSLQDSRDNHDPAGSSGKHRIEVFELDPSDAEDGDLHEIVNAADIAETDGRAPGFGESGVERAEADVVRAIELRGLG